MGVRCMVIAKKTPAGGRCGHTCYTDSRMELRNVVTSTGEAPARREESKNTFCLPPLCFHPCTMEHERGKTYNGPDSRFQCNGSENLKMFRDLESL